MIQEGTHMKNFNLFLRDDLGLSGVLVSEIKESALKRLKMALKGTQNKVYKLFGLFNYFYKPFGMIKTQKNIL